MVFSMELRVQAREAARITLKQRQAIESHLLLLRLELIEALRELRYDPRAHCPRCRCHLTLLEILQGFSDDPADFTTACPECGERFAPRLAAASGFSRVELPFYCAAQTQQRFRQLGSEIWRLTPYGIRRAEPALYHSAIFHFGSLRNLFASISVHYPHHEITAWRRRIQPFLGRLPDSVIARYVGRSASTIWRYRHSLGIAPFERRRALAEADDDFDLSSADENSLG